MVASIAVIMGCVLVFAIVIALALVLDDVRQLKSKVNSIEGHIHCDMCRDIVDGWSVHVFISNGHELKLCANCDSKAIKSKEKLQNMTEKIQNNHPFLQGKT